MTVPASLKFTYRDYLLLPEVRRYEVIDGDLFMTPAPTPRHQEIAGTIYAKLREFVIERGLGKVFIAPCDVVLSETDVLQPDVFFVSMDRLGIIGEKNISGAPDLVVEVLSPATAERDRTAKAKQYARFGVREMWLVDPEARTVEVLVNTTEGFCPEATFAAGETLRSPLLSGLEILVEKIF